MSPTRGCLRLGRTIGSPVLACTLALGIALAVAADRTGLDVLRPGGSDRGFARAIEPRAFAFPADDGPHPHYRNEWWYVTGHLQTPRGARFGFELTFFRIGIVPPAPVSAPDAASSGAANRSAWRTRQIYAAHFAITDLERGRFHSAQRFARDALGLAGAHGPPVRVWLEGWSLAEPTPGDWQLHAADAVYGLSLALHALSPPVLNGDRGLSVKSDVPGAASYYYSVPRLAARGELVRGGQRLPVSGLAWLDREWGTSALAPQQRGWDWFGLQLDDGSALMFYALRDAHDARDAHSAGTWVDSSGRTRPLASSQVQIEVERHWVSPEGARYPSRWRIRVPAVGLDVAVIPVLADQELETTPRYWEGEVIVAGASGGRTLAGRGYVELVGYPGRRR
ncbi:MAG TPA: lipocalin-like domain-containing protein [Steroidobacteraceae bacterium]|nr:lipocalin-like domain-containing protein [Steroidobacteraceae bacterium]